MSDDCELLEDFTRADGVEVETYSDGSARFSGNGGGVLWYLSASAAMASPPSRPQNFEMEALLMARDRLLMVTKQGEPLFPEGRINISEPDSWKVLSNFKGEIESLMGALLRSDAQFFRTLGDILKPSPERTRSRNKSTAAKDTRDDAVLYSIAKACRIAGGLPTFKETLKEYRELRYDEAEWPRFSLHLTSTEGETSSQFSAKLAVRGFGWLVDVTDGSIDFPRLDSDIT